MPGDCAGHVTKSFAAGTVRNSPITIAEVRRTKSAAAATRKRRDGGGKRLNGCGAIESARSGSLLEEANNQIRQVRAPGIDKDLADFV